MFPQPMLGSNYPSDHGFSSSKKKASTPALIFFKSQKDSSTKLLTENNSSLINTNRSPMRNSNAAKNTSLISRSPLLSKSNLCPSESKRSENHQFTQSRRNLQLNSQQSSMKYSVHYCENHTDRPANYMTTLDQSNTEYYCEKCAILLASQGYKVQKISFDSDFQSRTMQASRNILSNSMLSQKSSRSQLMSNSRSVYESSNSRKVEIQNFLSMSKGLLEQIDDKKDEIKENLIKSEEFYGQQIEEVNEYFELVYKSLELEKNKCYNYILNQRIQVQKPVRMINDTICELKEKIQGIIDDIQQNIATVYQTTDEIYRPVIQQYEDNYQQISRKIAQIDIFEVEMRKIDFEGVPDSIFCISDILKESIEQNHAAQHQKQMSNQLNSLKQSLRESLPQLQPKKLFSKRNQSSESVESNKCLNNNNKFCFSFEGEALQAQLEHEKIIYERNQ